MSPLSSLSGPARIAVVAAIVLCLPVLGAGWIAVRSYQREARYYEPFRRTIELADATALPGVTPVAFEASTGTIEGWYAPSTNGAAVVLVHGSSGDRRGVLPEAAILADDGYGVLLIDMPGHGESEGDVDWADGGRAAVVAALDYLEDQPDVEADRLGVVGSSMGGFIATQVAATDQRLRATVVVSAPHDQDEVTRWQNRRYGPISELPALWAMERGGLERDDRPPIGEIGGVGPRAVLVVGGTDDQFVPAAFAQRLFDAASEPKELVLLEGVGHGNHVSAGGEAFAEPLRRFLGEHLLAPV